ncbi:MAG: tetraacyldisaccharide 4'-kinase [Planctomycetota bacterium]|nr:tetraacyldisaccharide 4'-kinase [Planctomycetota bacterium]
MELLRVPALLYGVVADLRRSLYDRGLLPVERLDVPVVCVGNLSAGGTGKTPMVAWLARVLAERGRRPGLLSRGYGAGDEMRELAELLPDVPREEDPDRAAGGRRLVGRGADVIVMDDGFQHRRLHRDLDLVLVDATRPWGLPQPPGGGDPVCALIPRGLLRERPSALTRADAIVLTRTDQASAEVCARLEAELEALAPGKPLTRARHRPRALRGPAGEELAPEALAGAEVDLLSGIGNPEAFEETVRALGARVAEHRRFPDHHPFAPEDLEGLGRERILVTTSKDAARLGPGRNRAHVLEIELEIAEGRDRLLAMLDALPRGRGLHERENLHEGLHG